MNMCQEALIIMELQEMEMSSHRNAKNLLNSSGPNKNKQWQEAIVIGHPYTIKCTKYVMLKITSDFGMKHMTKTSLAVTEVFLYRKCQYQ